MTTSTLLLSSTGINHACRSHYRSHENLSLYPCFSLKVWKDKDLNIFGGQHDSLSFFASGKRFLTSGKLNRKYVVCSSPLPSPPSSNSLNGWLIVIILSLILPFFRNKLGSSLQLNKWTNRVEAVIETVEEVVEDVEKVAEEVDKIAEVIVNDLPAGQLKDAAKAVENFSAKTAKLAHAVDDLLEKVDMELKAEELAEDAVHLPTDAVKAVESFSEKTAKVADHAAGDIIKDKVKDVDHKAEERVTSLVESFIDEVDKSPISEIEDVHSRPKLEE